LWITKPRLAALAEPAVHNTPTNAHNTIAESHRILPAAPAHPFADRIIAPIVKFITANRVTGPRPPPVVEPPRHDPQN
jgi:hypothetical protein